MTDIVGRLREAADFMAQGKAVFAQRTCAEAAAEIERLRAAQARQHEREVGLTSELLACHELLGMNGVAFMLRDLPDAPA